MKKSVWAGLAVSFLITVVFAAGASADWYNGCKKKEEILEHKIEYAKKRGNYNQVRGLEQSLWRVRMNCTEASMSSKAESKIADKRAKVEERQRELNEARREGAKPDKIKKRQRKLDEAKAELAEAIREANSRR